MATLCLLFLIQSLKTPTRRMSSDSSSSSDDEKFILYASSNFGEHVRRSAAADESIATKRLLSTLGEFFSGPVLFWVQRQAEDRNLSSLTRLGKNLKYYIVKRCQLPTHLEAELNDLHSWADDLIHIVTAFSKDLYKDPRAIHTVIPSLCPLQSKIYSELRNPAVGLEIFGLSNTTWPVSLPLGTRVIESDGMPRQ